MTPLLEHTVDCTMKHIGDEYFGRDLWIVLNETVMVVKQEWEVQEVRECVNLWHVCVVI